MPNFNELEISIEDGQPIYLYRFTLNDKIWRYTSADDDLVIEGAVWEAVPIADNGVKVTGESNTDALTLTTTTDIMPSQIYSMYPPARPMAVAILRIHENAPDDIKTVYVGEVSQHNIPKPGMAVFTCETMAATMRREGLRLAWQRDCPYALYDPVTCRADKEQFKTVVHIDSMVGVRINSANLLNFPDNILAGGFFEWLDPVRGIERRAIGANSAFGSLDVFGSIYGIEAGMTINVYRGCAHNVTACISFGNLLNYGGIPDLPGKSPFDGDPVFI